MTRTLKNILEIKTIQIKSRYPFWLKTNKIALFGKNVANCGLKQVMEVWIGTVCLEYSLA